MLSALRRQEEGFGSQSLKQSLQSIARNNLELCRSQALIIKFPDPVLSVMDGNIFTLKKVLKCWDRYSLELKWQYPDTENTTELLIPLFIIGQSVLCAQSENRYFKVLSLDKGKPLATTVKAVYESIHLIGERVFVKAKDKRACEFFWKENRMADVSLDFQKTYLTVDESTYNTRHQRLLDLGFSRKDWTDDQWHFDQLEHMSIMKVDDVKQLDIKLGDSVFYEDQFFSVTNLKNVSVRELNGTDSKVIYKLDEPGFIDKIFIQDGYLILEIHTFEKRSSVFIDPKTFEELATFVIENDPYTETDYLGQQTSTKRSLFFDKGSYFRFMGSTLQVLDFNQVYHQGGV